MKTLLITLCPACGRPVTVEVHGERLPEPAPCRQCKRVSYQVYANSEYREEFREVRA
jgi:endogenous inhibitor of DNA gyrase (YacG/DUF329 family)